MPRRVLRTREPAFTAEDGPVRRGVHELREELGVTSRFPDDVRAEAEDAARNPRLPDLDRTDIPFVTIDPPGARDLDQALHLERTGSGYRVHYAIADVAAFVAPGGAVDEEAHHRGETLYDVGGKVPLHPPVLSEGACSLLPDGERPALLWTIDLDEAGERTAVRVERARVRSRAQLSYDGVQADLDAGRADAASRPAARGRAAPPRARAGPRRGEPAAARPGGRPPTATGGAWRCRSPLPVEGWNAQISLLTGMAAASLMTEARIGDPADPAAGGPPRPRAAAPGGSRRSTCRWPDDLGYPDLIRSLDPATRRRTRRCSPRAPGCCAGRATSPSTARCPSSPCTPRIASTYAHCTAPLRRLVDRYAGEICLAAVRRDRGAGLGAARARPVCRRRCASPARRASQYERGVLDLVEAVVLRGPRR